MLRTFLRWPAFFMILCWIVLTGAHAEPTSDSSATVVFRNGDKLSGKLLRVDARMLELENAALGQLHIHWSDISEVQTQNGSWKRAGQREDDDSVVHFRNAVMRQVDSAVAVSADSARLFVPEGESLVFEKQEHPAAGLPQLANTKAPKESHPDTSFAVSLNAPESVAVGTQSQYVFGGGFRVLVNEPDLCAMPSWFSSLLATGNHTKTFEVGSASVVTDTYDGTLSLVNRLGPDTQFAGYVVADWFGNSSLGVGLQQSYGAGINRVLYTNGCQEKKAVLPKGHLLSVSGDASLRYIHQSLYSPGGSEDLAGLRLAEDLTYVMYAKKKAGDTKELLSISQTLWVTPMLNNGKAVQAGASLGISVPVTKSLSVGLTEEDDFFNNAPKAKRKNYLQNSLTVTYTLPPPAK
jgi:hypothetical protein